MCDIIIIKLHNIFLFCFFYNLNFFWLFLNFQYNDDLEAITLSEASIHNCSFVCDGAFNLAVVALLFNSHILNFLWI